MLIIVSLSEPKKMADVSPTPGTSSLSATFWGKISDDLIRADMINHIAFAKKKLESFCVCVYVLFHSKK